jgi:hypothetical protein
MIHYLMDVLGGQVRIERKFIGVDFSASDYMGGNHRVDALL